MYKTRFFGWSLGVMLPLYDAPDAGGGGGAEDDAAGDGFTGEHPDFAFPGNADGDEGDPLAGDKPPAPAAGDPAAPQPGQAGEGAGKPGHKPGTTETIPGYRFQEVVQQRDELKTRFTALEAENAKFKKLISGALGIADPDNPGQPKPLDARSQAIADRIVEILPWLKDLKVLAEKAQSLSGLADSVPEFQRQNETYWKRVAQTMLSGMEESIAPLFLGEGKKATDLSPAMRNRYRADFIGWVKGDPTRVQRYEASDSSLVDDYRKELDETVIAPIRRQSGAAALTQHRGRAKLPVAGSGSAPTVGAPPNKPGPLNEDTAADAAWAKLKELTTTGA